MNTSNNRRRQATRERIESVFIRLLQEKELSQITVSDICKLAQVNRTTFYANYLDIYDLADTLRDRLEEEVKALYAQERFYSLGNDYLRLFRHIKDNQLFYKTYFKLGYDGQHSVDLGELGKNFTLFPKEHLSYHVAFHKAGLNAIITQWLAGGCQESPETLVKIIEDEYRNRGPVLA